MLDKTSQTAWRCERPHMSDSIECRHADLRRVDHSEGSPPRSYKAWCERDGYRSMHVGGLGHTACWSD